jgi:NADH-quinone oxidoreductase subunit L
MNLEIYFLFIILIPFLATLFLGLNFLVQRFWSEKYLIQYVRMILTLGLLLSVYVILQMILTQTSHLTLNLGDWFSIEDYHFKLLFELDLLSAPYVFLIYVLANIIGRYSANYLVGEMGVYRFFFLLLLFVTSILTVVTAGSIDLFFIGWELVGLSSVMLIGFYPRREISVKFSFKAFIAYKIGDIALLSAAMLIHHLTHSAEFHEIFKGHWPHQTLLLSTNYALGVSLLLIVASMGKSSQFPLCSWLPRAMEGPTPSSAIFYGALSIHLGPYLLLRMWPFLKLAPEALIFLFLVGLITAVYGTFVGRTRTDVKTSLAYSTMAQVGIIMIEISLGLHTLAIFHLFGHACLRTLQFLRSSSILQDFMENPHLFYETKQSSSLFKHLLPLSFRKKFYYAALDGFYWDQIIINFIQIPSSKILNFFKRLEEAFTSFPLKKKNHE